MNNRTAIILAAGKGARMMPLTKDIPKALLEVAGKPLIAHMLHFVREAGARDIVVVGGHCFSKLKEVVSALDSSVTVADNTRFELQNLVSFQTGLQQVKENTDVLVCDADYIFQKSTVDAVKKPSENILVYSSYDLSGDKIDKMWVRADGAGKLTEMSKGLTEYDAVYTGAFFIPQKHLALVRDVMEHILKTQDPASARVEAIFGELLRRGEEVFVCDVGPANWFEFDTPEDIINAKKFYKETRNK